MVPLILGAAALASAGYGISKGIDAKEKIDRAKRMVRNAEAAFEEVVSQQEESRKITNKTLEVYGERKLKIFSGEIKELVNILQLCGNEASSTLLHKMNNVETLKRELSSQVNTSLEILSGVATGAVSGALTAIGAYGGVGALASASTGASIAGLSGAAATNATLAWLGGGSLAAGGLGIAGGTAVLGGIIAGPAIAITGLIMDSKAEESLTEAREFRRDVNIKIEKINNTIQHLNDIRDRVTELNDVIDNLVKRFNDTLDEINSQSTPCEDKEKIRVLIKLGVALKQVLEVSILNESGEGENPYFDVQLNEAVQEVSI